MRRFLFIVPALLIMLGCASAAEKTKEVKLTNEQAILAMDALNRLDGYDKVVMESGKDRVVNVRYQFDINFRYAIARNASTLEAAVKPLRKAQQDRLMEVTGGTGAFLDQDDLSQAQKREELVKAQRLNAEWTGVLEQAQTYALQPMTLDDLKLKDNPIPPTVIKVLLPILSAD